LRTCAWQIDVRPVRPLAVTNREIVPPGVKNAAADSPLMKFDFLISD